MMGTKNNPGAHDCHAAAGPDEPIFTLRAKDPLAGMLVRRWAYLFQARKKAKDDYGPDAQRKYMEAHDVADAMDRWHREHCPPPPEPEAEADAPAPVNEKPA